MRKSLALTALAAVSACSEPAEQPPLPSEIAAIESAIPATHSAEGPAPGTYEVSDKDGKVLAALEIRDGGQYIRTPVDGTVQSGEVSVVDGKTCFDPAGDEAATCFLDSAPGPDGSFSATMGDGTVLRIKPKMP